MKYFARLCRDHALAVVAVCLLATVPVAVGISFLEVRAGQKDLIPRKYETSRTLQQVNELFGGTTMETPMVESDGLLSYPMIKKFLLLEEEMAEAVGEDSYVYMEHYLTAFARNALNEAKKQYGPLVSDIATILKFGEGTLVPDPSDPSRSKPFEEVIEDGVALYLANPVAHKWTVEKKGQGLLSADGRYAQLIIKINPDLDSAQRKALATRMEDFFHAYFEGGEVPATVYVSGDPSIDKDLEEYVYSSTWLLAVLALIVLVTLLFIAFQRLTDVVLPLAVIALSTIWIYGLMGWVGYPFTVISAIIGPLVLGISLGNVVYMMGRFYEEFGLERDPGRAAYRSVVTVGVAVFLACITTVIGFATFLLSDFDVLREFGIMCAAGIGVCFLFSVTFLPSLMILRERRRQRKGAVDPRGVEIFSPRNNRRIDRALGGIASLSQHRPGAVVVVYGFIVLICVMGTFRLTTTPDLRALAPQDIPSLQAQYLQESIFGGVQQDVLLVTGEVMEPRALAAMMDFQERIAATPYFSEKGSASLGELLRDFRVETGRAGPADSPEAALPSTRAEAEETLAELEALMGPQEGKLVSGDHRAALISIFSEGARNNQEMLEKDRILTEAAEEAFGSTALSWRLGGITPLTADMMGNLVPTQIWTAVLALCLSALVLVLIFRSLTFGLATLSVLVAGIAVELGFLSLMGWTLDMMTVLISSLIIGMGIDYGIHVTHRFIEEYEPGEVSVAEALRSCVTRVGKPLLASAVATAGSFLVVSFSRMAPIRRFSLVTALALTASLAASLLVLPSIITLIARRHLLVRETAPPEAADLKPAGADAAGGARG
ncbi:MAG: MMPL family transporter [Actinomycetota bacterium]|nr:MMPL family transporter [Actinomycetota bacterium]